MLCGIPPFTGDSDEDIMEAAKKGKFNFNHKPFDNVSNDAKNLIKKFLNKDVKKRLSAEQALNDQWFSS